MPDAEETGVALITGVAVPGVDLASMSSMSYAEEAAEETGLVTAFSGVLGVSLTGLAHFRLSSLGVEDLRTVLELLGASGVMLPDVSGIDVSGFAGAVGLSDNAVIVDL